MQPLSTDKSWTCIIKASGKYGLLALRDASVWTIHGFPSEVNGLDYFEHGYNEAHARSYEASMSACLNAIFFQPSILELTIAEVESMIDERKVQSWRNVAGRVTVVPLNADKAGKFWESGRKPALIGSCRENANATG